MENEAAKPVSSDVEMSPTIGKLTEALAKAQSEISGATKDSSNPFFKSKYADLSNVIDAAKPLSAHGLAFIQIPIEDDLGVCLTTVLSHSSGEWIKGKYRMRPVKNDPQGIGSCLTYMRRYALSAFVGIAQVDDDANAASKTETPKTVPNSKAKTLLEKCKTLDELGSAWESLNKDDRKSCGDIKDQMKTKLSKAA